ncbi:MAG: adenosylhomocysteinase [Candidatus Eremiobacteraeota bacterium]|nr:adenosylhomocysteinase [Candidatus Eremiobacteraeota bacterium]
MKLGTRKKKKVPPYHIKSKKLADEGQLRIDWAENNMPVLRAIKERFRKEKPLSGKVVGACLHVTTETANLMLTLKAGGAKVALCASNPLSTQDDVAAALTVKHKIPVYAISGEDNKTYYQHIRWVLEHEPNVTMDDGADLITTLHKSGQELIPNVIGGTEETTTGVIRLRNMEKQGTLKYPVIAVNDSRTKYLFDNRYGTGQSTIDGILRATNVLLAGSIFVTIGYGWCGRGIAMRARGMGANVIVIEVDPLRALEAVMDGFRVMPLKKASSLGDIFCTATGDTSCIRKEHFKLMKDGAIICNSGHFNVEIKLDDLAGLSRKKRRIREFVEEYVLENGRRIFVLGEGRLINLAAAEGHPAHVMDMSFANQALACEFLFNPPRGRRMENKVYRLPEIMDREIARLKLKTMGIGIDTLTPEQKKYLAEWSEGT